MLFGPGGGGFRPPPFFSYSDFLGHSEQCLLEAFFDLSIISCTLLKDFGYFWVSRNLDPKIGWRQIAQKLKIVKNNVKFGLPMVELVGIDTPYVLHDEKKIPKKRKMRNFGGYAIFRPPLEGEPKEISKNGFLHQIRDEKVGIYIKYEIGFV